MGYRTYMSGELKFNRPPSEEELQKLRVFLAREDIIGLVLEKTDPACAGPDSKWIIAPAESTKCGNEMLDI